MTIARIIAFGGLLVVATVLAQQPNQYNGTWRVEFDSKKGVAREGTVVIKDQGGTWDVLHQKKNDPCAGRAAPISIQRVTEDELVFEISTSKALTGCEDRVVKLRRTDEKTLQGAIDDGRKIRLVRQ